MMFWYIVMHMVAVGMTAYDLLNGASADHPIRVAGEIAVVVGWGWVVFAILTDEVLKRIRAIQ